MCSQSQTSFNEQTAALSCSLFICVKKKRKKEKEINQWEAFKPEQHFYWVFTGTAARLYTAQGA